ncbi:calcium-binding protein [Tieghemostelium lacteum]|uniref:Calcium-binding protein n=1 Tax=Tieghemostelium lacteum TaxID=361077 RepID=A0A152A1Y0_TIELA|nr:calcium-binding protein [Tieghemostelium lacteum]|eukprot:KYR00127.1 calcium-binding protein [Tieghemostelium lacteum]
MGSQNSKLDSADVEYLSKQTSLSKNEITKLHKEFKEADKDKNGSFNRAEFIEFFKPRLPNFPQDHLSNLFDTFDTDKSGSIDFKELSIAISIFGKASAEEKLTVLFDVWDKDASGSLEKVEIESLVKMMVEVGKAMGKKESDVTVFINKLFEKLDADKSNTITKKEWVTQGASSPSLLVLLGVTN